LGQNRFDHSKASLSLWSPTPSNERKLQDAFQAAKASASWLGIETLTTKTIERYVPTLEKMGFKVESRVEPYLTKDIDRPSP